MSRFIPTLATRARLQSNRAVPLDYSRLVDPRVDSIPDRLLGDSTAKTMRCCRLAHRETSVNSDGGAIRHE